MNELLIALALICQTHFPYFAQSHQKKCVAELYACIQPTVNLDKKEGEKKVLECLRK